MATKKVETIIDDETEATVIETTNSDGKTTKRVNYTAKVKENDVIENDEMANNQDENFDDESNDLFLDTESEEIPKDKLDKMFDDIEKVSNGINNIFFAKVTRQPDSLSDNFFNRCGGEMPLGVFQFSLRDRFNFIPQLQKINGNSGGYFNILIFDGQQKPLGWSYRVGYSRETAFKHIGCHNVLVPNPALIETANTNGQPQQNNNGLDMLFGKMVEMMQQNHNQLMQVINRAPEKSTLEKAIEQKVLNDILNPPERKESNFENTMAQTMTTILAAPVMIEKMSSKMFPAAPVEKEPNLAEQIQNGIKGALEIEPINNLFNVGVNSLALYAEKRLSAQAQATIENLPNQTEQPNPNQLTEPNEMSELIKDVIAELETKNPLDETNEFLQDLESDFPDQTMMIKAICKTQSFEQVLQRLINQSDSLKPNPFIVFLDMPKTQETKSYVWNDKGEAMVKRLKEFYEYAKK